jgi:hypothetical protein
MRKTKEQRTVELVGQYRGLAMKLAWDYWKRLPAATKMWVDPDDLIAEAICHIVTFVLNDYDKKRASLSTFMYCSTNGHLMNFALAQTAAKRYGFRADLEDAWGVGVKESKFQLVDALNAFEAVYGQASEGLQDEICQWFGVDRKAPRRSAEGKELIREFGHLAYQNRLSESDCRLLLRSGVWVP